MTSILAALTPSNPVLLREARERVTARRSMVIITLWLMLLASLVAIVYSAQTGTSFGDPFGGGISQLAEVGQSLFEWVLFFMMGLVLFLVPGFTAAAIAGERERQTLLPLQVTLLRPRNIIMGKIGASLAFTLMLLIATLPLLAFAYLIGGVTFYEIFWGMGMVVFSAFSLACLTVMCSAIVKRVQGAIVLAYGLVLLMVVGSFVVYGVAWAIDDSRGFDQANPPVYILAANPVAAVADVSGQAPGAEQFFNPWGDRSVNSPLAVVREAMYPFEEWRMWEMEPIGFDNFGNPIFPDDAGVDGSSVPFWAVYLMVMTALSVLAVLIAIRRVRTPAKTER